MNKRINDAFEHLRKTFPTPFRNNYLGGKTVFEVSSMKDWAVPSWKPKR
jgi:hypothetical protein